MNNHIYISVRDCTAELYTRTSKQLYLPRIRTIQFNRVIYIYIEFKYLLHPMSYADDLVLLAKEQMVLQGVTDDCKIL
jgi:hypothetical protein